MAIYELDGKQPEIGDGVWIAPTADVIGDVVLEDDATVWFGAVARADCSEIRVGKRSNIQDMTMLHSDHGVPLKIGEEVTVGHKCILHGCTIGDRALIGMGAIVMNHAVIGEESIVGAGAVITEGKEFPPRSLIVGAPAKAIRTLGDEAVQMLRGSAAHYAENGESFGKGLKKIAD
ncbi:MAG: gamma carbonic anhydrase family protein [Pacificimonas sp.]|jgi:carbonic anhydrase/acetyltransferase-like protein (isoleucine patch superfamily)|nr:gamma carbonic anhydrase family protein [Pacificimonas sp.]